jgi:uncharacterized protein (TIGR03437 family)
MYRLSRIGRWLAVAMTIALPVFGQPTVQAVLNGASYRENVAPGTWIAIFGTQLAPSTATASAVPLPTRLNGVSVTFGAIPAPLLFVSPGQINALVPFELLSCQTLSCHQLVITNASGTSKAFGVLFSQDAPGQVLAEGVAVATVVPAEV